MFGYPLSLMGIHLFIHYICKFLQQKAKKNSTFVYAGSKPKNSTDSVCTSALLRVFTTWFVRCNFFKQFEPPLNAVTH